MQAILGRIAQLITLQVNKHAAVADLDGDGELTLEDSKASGREEACHQCRARLVSLGRYPHDHVPFFIHVVSRLVVVGATVTAVSPIRLLGGAPAGALVAV